LAHGPDGLSWIPARRIVSSTTSDNAFRWDPSAQQWIFNISTSNLPAGKTYTFLIQLNGGGSISFQFGLK
jgi:hypothetical protein